MSIQSWREEFFPTDATPAISDEAALAQALLKWRGLRPAALRSHQVVLRGQTLMADPLYAEDDSSFAPVFIAADTCSLCHKYLKTKPRCTACPLYRVRETPCDRAFWGAATSPYACGVRMGGANDPEPMIALLEQATREMQKPIGILRRLWRILRAMCWNTFGHHLLRDA